jgi:hypothetical protein
VIYPEGSIGLTASLSKIIFDKTSRIIVVYLLTLSHVVSLIFFLNFRKQLNIGEIFMTKVTDSSKGFSFWYLGFDTLRV